MDLGGLAHAGDYMYDEVTKRRKILSIPYEMVLDCLQGKRVVRLDAGLPKGYQILCVYSDPTTRSIDYVIFHESFDEVPACQYPPRIMPNTWLIKGGK